LCKTRTSKSVKRGIWVQLKCTKLEGHDRHLQAHNPIKSYYRIDL